MIRKQATKVIYTRGAHTHTLACTHVPSQYLSEVHDFKFVVFRVVCIMALAVSTTPATGVVQDLKRVVFFVAGDFEQLGGGLKGGGRKLRRKRRKLGCWIISAPTLRSIKFYTC